MLPLSVRPLTDERIAELYPSRTDYEEQFAAAADAAIEGGFILEEDREAIETYEHAELVPE